MPAPRDDLSGFARAIALGEAVPPGISADYRQYSAAVAIDIYRNNYRGNLHDALTGAYPVFAQLVGKEFFRMLARRYIGLYPSRSGDLHRYGGEMAGFIAGYEPAQGLPYLADVAALEWACHRAYFAEDAAKLDVASLALIPPGRYSELTLQVHPACRLLRSDYPVVAIWQAHQPGAAEDFRIDLHSGPSIALVSRKDGAVRVSELAEADAGWLEAVKGGAALGAATSAVLERHPGFDLPAALLNLATRDVLVDFNLGKNP